MPKKLQSSLSAEESSFSLDCPKCIHPDLVEVHPNLKNLQTGSGIFNCEKCWGHWLDREPIEAYLAKQDQTKAEAFRSVWHSPPQSISIRKCFHDQVRLHTITFHEVELDVCAQCKGLWFDALELETISGVGLPKKRESGERSGIAGIDGIDVFGDIFGAIFGGGW